MINITIWSDFACPYCYIGETRLKNAIDDLGIADKVNVEYRAYELDPTAPKEAITTTPERFAKKYRLTLDQAKAQVEEISQLGRDLCIDFNYVNSRYSNTRDAHRLMKLAEAKYDKSIVELLNYLLFDAYFTKSLLLADHEVLMQIAKEAGMKEEEAKHLLDSNDYDDEVRYDEREASMRGVRGVPYMVFNDRLAIPGAISTEDCKHLLRQLMDNDKDDNAAKGDHPHACGADGCQLA